ncbi:MAG: SusC/RagA family TonB-linked outer membrane protein [Bacteroidales bacterium]
MRKFLSFLVLYFVLLSGAYAQNPITGTVVDKSGIGIAGSTVIQKGTTNGAITDAEGNFSLNAPKNSTLIFSFMGMKSQEVEIGNQSVINITMEEDAIGLDEVVAIGYGTQKKSDLTGSVSHVSTDDLSTQSNTTIGQALQGKMAGVDIVSSGGAPGSGSRIMIRGVGTLNNSTPLYIIDGIYMSSMDFLNPNDIESINVLKDASASAIYGSRAANGVVIITTKSGNDSKGVPSINFSANVGFATPAKYMDLLDAKGVAEVVNLARTNSGLEPLKMLTDLDSKENNDWQDIMMGPALRHNYNLSLSGGTEKFKYYSGIGFLSEDGIIKGTDYQRINGQFKSSYQKGWFSAGNNILLNYQDTKPSFTDYPRGGLYGTILQSFPTMSVYDENNLGGYGSNYGDAVNIINPLATTDPYIYDAYQRKYSIYAQIWAQIEFIRGLKYKIEVTPSIIANDNMNYTGKYDMGIASTDRNSLDRTQTLTQNVLVENTLNFDRTFGNHKLTALLGYTYQTYKYRYLNGSGTTIPTGLLELDATTLERAIRGNLAESALVSVLSRIFYSYKDKILITGTLRRDASSKFSKANRVGYFPSFSVGYNIAEEAFLDNAEWLDALKIRGGYGELGNQEIGNYKYSSTIKTGINYANGEGGVHQGAFPVEFVNPEVEWEKTSMINIGIDLTAIHNKFSTTLDLYNKITNDILLSVPIPYSTGGTNDPIQNIGKISNKGFEFALSWRDDITSDLNYSVNFNGNFMKNNVENLASDDQVINSGQSFRGSYTTKTLKDYPIGGFWLIETDGLFQSWDEINAYTKDGNLIQSQAMPGDVKFVDANNDGVINDDDRVYMGSPFPKFTFGLNTSIAYKNLDLRLDFQGVFGNKIFNDTRNVMTSVINGTNYLASTLDYWTENNKDASQPYLRYDDPNGNYRTNSDRYLEKGNFVRVRSIQLGYNIPTEGVLSTFTQFRTYINIENPFTFTNYTGVTPDYNSFNSYSRGNDYFAYPASRVYMFGINVTF